jgi:outer membrane protein
VSCTESHPRTPDAPLPFSFGNLRRGRFGRLPNGAVALMLAVVVAPAHAQDVRSLTIDEAVRLAIERSPAAVAARGAMRVAGSEVLEARGAWLPAVNALLTYGNSSNERFDQASGRLVSQSYVAQAQTSWELFAGGRRLAQARAALARLHAVEAEERGQRYATALETTRIFYAAAAAEELLAAARQRAERARRQLEFAETRLLVGTATRSDVLRARLETEEAELGLVDAQSELRTSGLLLARQVGSEEPVRPAPGSLPEAAPPLPPVAELVSRAERSAPAAVAAREELESAQAETWVARAQYLPTLRATGGYDWFAFEWPPDQESWTLRVIASWPLFNGFQREAAVSRAEATRRTAEAIARDAALGVRIAVEDAALEVEAAGRRIEIARRALDLAAEDLRVIEERYQIGAATILDLQASQLALTEAEAAWVRARQELGVVVAALEAELGSPVVEAGT